MGFLPDNYHQMVDKSGDLSIVISTKGWFVMSESDYGTYYLVRKGKKDNKFYCSCKDSSIRKHECKHCVRVRDRFKVL